MSNIHPDLRKKAAAYAHLFDGKHAETVLNDLNTKFNASSIKKVDGEVDPNATLIMCGAREVLLYIDYMLRIAHAPSE